MTKQLVLIRHGKAESRAEGLDDAQRTLTAAGRRALEAQMPWSLGLIGSVDRAELWVSPSERTRETAEVLCDALGIGSWTEHAALYDQDIDAFLTELGDASAETVIAVGHDPFVEEITARLCGQAVPFEKGAICAIDLDDLQGATSTVKWFVQGPEAGRWKTLGQIEKAIARGARRVQKFRKAFIADPSDIEALHHYRVAIRSLRSLVAFIMPYQKRKQNRWMRDSLRTLERTTSRLRELDVLCEQLEALAAAHETEAPDARVDEPTALETCRDLRDEECARLLAWLASKPARRVLKWLLDDAEHVHWKDSVEKEGVGPEEFAKHFDEQRDGCLAALHMTDYYDIEATHELRKRAKGVRYVATELAGLLGDERAAESAEMTRVQDELGVLCDARVTHQIVTAILEDEGLCPRVREELTALDTAQSDEAAQVLKHLAESV